MLFLFFFLFLAGFLARKHTHSLTLTLFNSYTLNQMAELKTLVSCIQSQKTVTAVSYFSFFFFFYLGFHKMCSLKPSVTSFSLFRYHRNISVVITGSLELLSGKINSTSELLGKSWEVNVDFDCFCQSTIFKLKPFFFTY